jgi:hypothetical protein
MRTTVKYLFTLMLSIVSSAAFSQGPEMADRFRAEGKIYVVVAIVLIVLSGLILYLFLLDRKVKKLENLVRDKKQTK